MQKKKLSNIKPFQRTEKLWNMKVTEIIVFEAPGIIPMNLEISLSELKIRGRIETILISALLKSAKILRIVLEIRGELLSLRIQLKSNSYCYPNLSILFLYMRAFRCNGYRRRKQTQPIDFKSWTKLFAIHTALITATYHPSRRPSKFDEQALQDTAGGARTNS